ncbi:MAG TPA: hypothetical protein VH372_15425 [Actinospica sp.]|jgi:hypothetical protein|nr:hypothetical protein [Actinospica sp.]
MALSDHRLIRLLEKLALPASDYVVTGSGPLLAHGLKNNIHDIDLVARGKAWEQAAALGTVRRSKSGLGRWIALCGGQIEVFDHWVGGRFDVDAMIDAAELVEGVPFMSLRETLRWKRGLGRAKDLRDAALIERYLAVPAR